MQAKIFDLSAKESGSVELPKALSTSYRPDVIKRAVLSLRSKKRQAYGTDVLAGKRTSAHYHGKRKYRWAMMNKEMSRIPRIHGKVGYLVWTARFAPHAVKGRRAHPPKAEKNWVENINAKENRLAIMSALSASANLDIVTKRGHKTSYAPLIFIDDLEQIKKSKILKELLQKLIPLELERCSEKKVRAGNGKNRNRKYIKKKGPLFLVSKQCDLMKSSRNIPGADVCIIDNVNAELLAPGTHAGRLVVTTKAALQRIEKW